MEGVIFFEFDKMRYTWSCHENFFSALQQHAGVCIYQCVHLRRKLLCNVAQFISPQWHVHSCLIRGWMERILLHHWIIDYGMIWRLWLHIDKNCHLLLVYVALILQRKTLGQQTYISALPCKERWLVPAALRNINTKALFWLLFTSLISLKFFLTTINNQCNELMTRYCRLHLEAGWVWDRDM
jgi:hypothetical protein